MYRVTRMLSFCYGHRLLNYEGKCKHPHGHNGRVEIELGSGTLDSRGMVVDFGDIKRVVQEWIDRELDHKMILKRGDPLIAHLSDLQEPFFTMEENPTAENIAKLIFGFVKGQRYPVTSVRLWETETSFATFSEEK